MHFIESTTSRSQADDQWQRAYSPMFDKTVSSTGELPGFLCLSESIGKLARVVRTDPSSALYHVQRIRLAQRLGETDQVAAAMYDLELAVQRDPQQLDKRIWELVGDSLLDTRERSHATHSGGRSAPPGSVLQPLAQAPRDFMAKTAASDTQPSSSVVGRAQSLMIDGRFDSARDLLEQTVVDDPGDQESVAELLFLYRTMHDQTSFFEMQATIGRLLPGATDHDPLWRGTQAYFRLVQPSAEPLGHNHA